MNNNWSNNMRFNNNPPLIIDHPNNYTGQQINCNNQSNFCMQPVFNNGYNVEMSENLRMPDNNNNDSMNNFYHMYNNMNINNACMNLNNEIRNMNNNNQNSRENVFGLVPLKNMDQNLNNRNFVPNFNNNYHHLNRTLVEISNKNKNLELNSNKNKIMNNKNYISSISMSSSDSGEILSEEKNISRNSSENDDMSEIINSNNKKVYNKLETQDSAITDLSQDGSEKDSISLLSMKRSRNISDDISNNKKSCKKDSINNNKSPRSPLSSSKNLARRRRQRTTKSESHTFSSQYDLLDNNDSILGSGAYAIVRLAIRKKDGKKFAVKLIDKHKPGNTREKCFNETKVLKRCCGAKNIIQWIQYFEDENYYFIVTEYIEGGNLEERLEDKIPISEYETALIAKDLATALNYLHTNKIAHRDIKPQNILCGSKKSLSPCIVTDFDLSNTSDNLQQIKCFINSNTNKNSLSRESLSPSSPIFQTGYDKIYKESSDNNNKHQYLTQQQIRRLEYNQWINQQYQQHKSNQNEDYNKEEGIFPKMLMDSSVGSPEYMSPEIAARFLIDDELYVAKYTERTDIWSLGVLLFRTLSGDVPFKARGCDDEDCQWEEGQACEDCRDSLFEEICQADLQFKAKIWQNISYQAKHLVMRCLTARADERISAEEILLHPFIKALDSKIEETIDEVEEEIDGDKVNVIVDNDNKKQDKNEIIINKSDNHQIINKINLHDNININEEDFMNNLATNISNQLYINQIPSKINIQEISLNEGLKQQQQSELINHPEKINTNNKRNKNKNNNNQNTNNNNSKLNCFNNFRQLTNNVNINPYQPQWLNKDIKNCNKNKNNQQKSLFQNNNKSSNVQNNFGKKINLSNQEYNIDTNQFFKQQKVNHQKIQNVKYQQNMMRNDYYQQPYNNTGGMINQNMHQSPYVDINRDFDGYIQYDNRDRCREFDNHYNNQENLNNQNQKSYYNNNNNNNNYNNYNDYQSNNNYTNNEQYQNEIRSNEQFQFNQDHFNNCLNIRSEDPKYNFLNELRSNNDFKLSKYEINKVYYIENRGLVELVEDQDSGHGVH